MLPASVHHRPRSRSRFHGLRFAIIVTGAFGIATGHRELRAQTAAPPPVSRPSEPDTLLQAELRRRIAAEPGAAVGVVYRDLATGRHVRVAADSQFHAASTMKVAVMIELFRRVDAGGLALEQPVLLVNEFASLADGSSYALSAADEDGDTTLYQRVGMRVPVRELLEGMITQSSNLATNAVLALVGPAETSRAAAMLGAEGMRVLRGVEDIKAYERGMSNTASAAALATLMTAIAEDRAASPASSAAMRAVLLRQAFADEIPAGLPAGTRVAHKTGQITAHLHDAAIIYPRDGTPYVLVVLTRGITDTPRASRLIADLSRIVWARRAALRGAATR